MDPVRFSSLLFVLLRVFFFSFLVLVLVLGICVLVCVGIVL